MERHYVIAAKSDIGNCKQVNQDSLTVKVVKTAIGEIAFAVICDGMGGLQHGEVASAHVVRSAQKWFSQNLIPWINKGMNKQQLVNEWNKMIEDCNYQIVKYGEKARTQLGTTITMVLLVQDIYYVAHVGDCRLYEVKNTLRQITKDHTFIAREVELGHMTLEQARNDSRKNVLTQCVGVNKKVTPDYLCGKMEEGVSLLLCSDGFRHFVSVNDIIQYCHINLQGMSLENNSREEIHTVMNQQIDYLIELNKSRGERDNLSAILIKSI